MPIRYSYSTTGELRRHYLNHNDVEILLSRLPQALWSRLKAVHFNDRSRGCRRLGYVNMGHREIAICALAPNVSLSRFLIRSSPKAFGAVRGLQWPSTAVRRFLLYDVFLHELGHLQIIEPKARRVRRRFASETMAQRFADHWRHQLWSSPFSHPDPIHNVPSKDELAIVEGRLLQSLAVINGPRVECG